MLSVDCRQVPDAALPGSIGDCVAAYRWLLARGYAAGKVAFVGDSAGGHLVFATALAAVENRLPSSGALSAVSPWVDFDDTARFAHRNARRDRFLPVKRIAAIKPLVLNGLDLDDPAHSPVNAALSGLSPVLIQVGAGEVLLSDAELMTERLSRAGVPTTLQIWHGQVHAFTVLAGLLPESARATAEIARFIDSAIHRSRRPT